MVSDPYFRIQFKMESKKMKRQQIPVHQNNTNSDPL